MTAQEMINILKMADKLWDRYTWAGLRYDVLAFSVPLDQHTHEEWSLRAQKHTALRTYLQFCERWDLNPGMKAWY